MTKVISNAEQRSSTPTSPADTRKRKRAEADVVAEHCVEGVGSCSITKTTYPQLPKLDNCEWCAGDFSIHYRSKKPIRNTYGDRIVCSPCLHYAKRRDEGSPAACHLPPLACCIESKLLSKVCVRNGLCRLPPDAKKYELKPILRKGVPVKGNDALCWVRVTCSGVRV